MSGREFLCKNFRQLYDCNVPVVFFFCESLSALSFLAAVVLTAVFFVVASCVKNGHIYRARGIGAVYPLFIFCEL